MFIAGKNTELFNFPARCVFKRLQVAKKTPINEPNAKFLPWTFVGPFLRNRKWEREEIKQNTNATKINEVVCPLYSEPCCIFCTMPSPPEQIRAIISGKKYDLEELFSPFDFFLIPEITSTGMAINIPKNPKIVIFSFQNITPLIVGIKNPNEYIVAQIAVFPFDNAIV